MKKNGLLIGLVLLIVIVFSLLLFLTKKTPPKPTNVVVYFTPPTPTPISSISNQSEDKTPAPEASPTPTITKRTSIAVETSDDGTPLAKRLLIQDALGEPIASGSVSLGSEPLKFTNGSFIIPETIKGAVKGSVSAEGYAPVQQTVCYATQTVQTVIMEYLSDFDVRVYEGDGKTPCPNATVQIWKAKPGIRPVRRECPIFYSNTINPARFRIENNDCSISYVDKNTEASPLHPTLATPPSLGDRLFAAESCVWNRNESARTSEIKPSATYLPIRTSRSSKLRIWDSIFYISNSFQNICWYSTGLHCVVERKNRLGFYQLFFPQLPDDAELVKEIQTGPDGRGAIDNLPPALYYAQAEKDGQKSIVSPLHPCCGGVKLTLSNTSDVRIIIRREGNPKNRLISYAYVEDFEVTLKAIDGKPGIFSETTQYTSAHFEKVPFGRYQLKIVLSEDISLTPIVEEIVIDEPYEAFHFKIKDWIRYSLSGKVINKKTNEPVEKCSIYLERENASYSYNTQISGEKGEFTFHDLIPANYRLSVNAYSFDSMNYLPKTENSANGPYLWKTGDFPSANMPWLSVTIVDCDVDNVVLPVEEIEKTYFSGTVVYEDGKPAVGASLTISAYTPTLVRGTDRAQTVPADAKSGENGSFSFYIVKNNAFPFDRCDFDVVATEGQIVPAYLEKMEDEEMYSLKKEEFIPTQIGSTHVSGKPADRFEDLKIVLKREIHNTAYIRLIADESDFTKVEMTAKQNTRSLAVENFGDGRFQINDLAPGEIKLEILPYIGEGVNTPYGVYSIWKYCRERLTLNMPENQPEMYVDVTLRKSGYFWGVVTNAQGEPPQDAWIDVKQYGNDEAFCGQAHPDERGFFFVGGFFLPMTERYQLVCYKLNKQGAIYKTKPMIPSVGEIEIRLPD